MSHHTRLRNKACGGRFDSRTRIPQNLDMRVLILHDAIRPDSRADELDVLVQSREVGRALETLGHQTETLPFDWNLEACRTAIERMAPDCVFNLVESVHGRGRLIYLAPALLDDMRIPYTGAGTEALFLTSNKLLTKRYLRLHGIDTPGWWEPGESDAKSDFRSGRYIIKSVWEEASVGLDEDSVVAADEWRVMEKAVERRRDLLGGEGFAEEYIDGREFNLALLGDGREPEVLPPAEIHFVGYGPEKLKVVGYRAKWDESSYEYHHTPGRFDFPPNDEPLLERLRNIARNCWNQFRLRGYARVDFRVDPAGRSYVLEGGANPCLSPDAGFAAALAHLGIPFEEAVRRILEDTIQPA
jgi:D-alanine-D-alanine ligase